MATVRRDIPDQGAGRRTKTRKTKEVSGLEQIQDTFEAGIEFFNTVSRVIDGVKQFVNQIPKKQPRKPSDDRTKEAAYRYMKLNPGCGKQAVRARFKEMVKEIRPDVNLDDLTRNKFSALQVAQDIISHLED